MREHLHPADAVRLKPEWSMLPLRIRRIEPVRLHVDLTMLAMLASALLAART